MDKLSDKLLRAYLYIPALQDQSLAGLEYLGEWAGKAIRFEKIESLAKQAILEVKDTGFIKVRTAVELQDVLEAGG